MRIDTLRVSCLKKTCGHVFDAEIVVEAPVSVAMASIAAIRCPKCGSSMCGLGGNHNDAPPLSASIAERSEWWIKLGEQGSSSLSIFRAIGGPVGPAARDGGGSIPWDPDDFRRCYQLLELIPEWKSELTKVSDLFPHWKPYVDRWPEMESLYAEERKGGQCPRLYAMLEACEAESKRVGGPYWGHYRPGKRS